MEQLFEQFQSYLLTEKCVAKQTFEAYSSDIRQFLDFLMSHNYSISIISIKKFLANLKKEQLLAACSMSRKISSLKLFFRYLHRYHGWENFAIHLTFPKIEKRLPHYLSEEDIEQLLAVTNENQSGMGMRNHVLLSLLYVSGLRISELVALKITDIHFDTGLIAVNGKGGKERLVPLPMPMLELLREYCAQISAQHVSSQKHYLFATKYGKKIGPISRQACWLIIKKLWRKTGIAKDIYPHMLRHSIATHLLKQGADLRSLQLLLGHEQLNTVQIYTHVETSYLRKIYDKKHPRS